MRGSHATNRIPNELSVTLWPQSAERILPGGTRTSHPPETAPSCYR
jgi:hypothetical protein